MAGKLMWKRKRLANQGHTLVIVRVRHDERWRRTTVSPDVLIVNKEPTQILWCSAEGSDPFNFDSIEARVWPFGRPTLDASNNVFTLYYDGTNDPDIDWSYRVHVKPISVSSRPVAGSGGGSTIKNH